MITKTVPNCKFNIILDVFSYNGKFMFSHIWDGDYSVMIMVKWNEFLQLMCIIFSLITKTV